MSSRNGRRHRKKTEEDPSFRPSMRREESLKMKFAEQAPLNIIPLKEENGKVDIQKPEVPIVIEPEVFCPPDPITETHEAANGNGVQQEVVVVVVDDAPSECDLEPLVIDSEEQELQFDDNSDIDSHKGSPVLTNRCATRRSQTRNIPTPKTPRVHDQNGDNKEQTEQPVEQNGCIADKQESQDNKEHVTQDDAEAERRTPMSDTNASTPLPTEENLTMPDGDMKENELNEKNMLSLSVDSCESALSTQVNVGSDLTREIDLTLPEESSFLNNAKNLTVVETLRRMSSRRAIRSGPADYRKTLLRSQAEKHEACMQQQRASMERVTATKRKTRSKTPENAKRFKTDSPAGFMSYISSPLTMLRNRFGSGDSMSASTPKLTGYREQDAMEDPELSKIEDSKAPIEKKRCVIM